MERIGVVGGGAFGTALATAAQRAGRSVVIWAREAEVVAAINGEHENTVFLAGVSLDQAIRATGDLAEVAATDALMLAVPAQFMRSVAGELAPHVPAGRPVVICAKGIERGSAALMSEVLAEVLPEAAVAVLAGPTFAGEVARGHPAAVTLASADADLGRRLVAALGTRTFRPYLSDDLIGAQIGGALKNVLAIACGIAEGRGLGANARAALLTRGFAEMARLGRAKGARLETLAGLAGLGDLVLTCTSLQSRNMSLGVHLGQGRQLDEILAERTSVAEGVAGAESASQLARRLGVEMPISTAVDGILNHFADIDASINGLLDRPFTAEGI